MILTFKSPIGGFCFAVKNREDDEWDLCANDKAEKRAWMCAIMSALGQNCEVSPSPLVKKLRKKQYFFKALDWNYFL